MATSNNHLFPRVIALEEHWLSAAVDQSLYKEQDFFPSSLLGSLCDAGKGRIAAMDAANISMQILSHTAGYAADTVHYAEVNDEMATAVAANPTRFAAFAHLPMADPQKAAEEFDRCIRKLGFKGALIDNHAGGRYYEGPEYDIFWAAVQKLDKPIYLHPTMPTSKMRDWYKGNYGPQAELSMSHFTFGWHSDTATHILRLYAGGVFERFPKIKIVLGHFGESLPFYLERIQWFSQKWGSMSRSFEQVYAENLWFTTSSLKGLAPLVCMLQNTKLDRIMFGVDYPFLQMKDGIDWLKQVRASGLLDEEAYEMITHGNAESFLGIN
ncbi:unnamed protein product [Clonostachys rosea]|uniref:Amidohydrolase-related domain-containing protein n=1 Tax=Bionectria ochroleuca TaxID=29856 RepID=A0ABY6UCB7_BIOOC|nr:unnamed protein product [Clonostachys rosea]